LIFLDLDIKYLQDIWHIKSDIKILLLLLLLLLI